MVTESSGKGNERLFVDIDINVGSKGKAGIEAKLIKNKLQEVAMNRLGIYEKLSYNGKDYFVNKKSLHNFLKRNQDLLLKVAEKTDVEKFKTLSERAMLTMINFREKRRIETMNKIVEAAETGGQVVRIPKGTAEFILNRLEITENDDKKYIYSSMKKHYDKTDHTYVLTAKEFAEAIAPFIKSEAYLKKEVEDFADVIYHLVNPTPEVFEAPEETVKNQEIPKPPNFFKQKFS